MRHPCRPPDNNSHGIILPCEGSPQVSQMTTISLSSQPRRNQQSVSDHARNLQTPPIPAMHAHSVVDHARGRQQSVLDHAHFLQTPPLTAMQAHSVVDHPNPQQASSLSHSVTDHAGRSESTELGQSMSNPGELVSNLDPTAACFMARDPRLVHRGECVPDLDGDWSLIQQIEAGQGSPTRSSCELWKHEAGTSQPSCIDPGPAQPVTKVSHLPNLVIETPFGQFTDKVLPTSTCKMVTLDTFNTDYFRALHNVVAAPGIRADGSQYPAFTPNFLGARVKLKHVRLKICRWRYHLRGYEHVDIVQHLEFGFPLGLQELPDLCSSQRNHGSAYNFFPHVDKFVVDEVVKGGVTGPLEKSPWWNVMVSPMMTAPKKPDSRRTVFDASFGERSLNNATPSDCYLGQPCIYTYPKIDDFRRMVLRCGEKSYMWKRDLSRFFLQIPLDPVEYSRVCFIWRGLFFFFVGLAFGLRHSGLQGQKLTDCVSWIHRRRGLETITEQMFNIVNYSDDFGGVETIHARAKESFSQLKWLLDDLGLQEAAKKAEPPSTQMTFLGVMFDSSNMTMRVPPDKLTEIKSEIGSWARKTTITKQNLQSLLGKLFWVARVIRYARVFMGRLLNQLRSMSGQPEKYKVKLAEESQKDLKWWWRYLDHFNGIQMIVEEDPFPLELEQLLDRPFELCAGDATPTGCGAWHGTQYWCRQFPIELQDPALPIHVKEFWCLIVSARLWGNYWSGRSVTIFCDNDAVVDTVNHRKPKDSKLLSLLREFLYIVVTMKFFPIVRKIGTKENFLADHISRRHDTVAANKVFNEAGLHNMEFISVPDLSFKLTEPW